jgi:hypothetical protein
LACCAKGEVKETRLLLDPRLTSTVILGPGIRRPTIGLVEVEDVLKAVLSEVEVLLGEAEDELRRLEDQVATLQAERYGLQLALARRTGRGPAVASSAPALGGGAGEGVWEPVLWHDLSRAEAVYQLLLDEGGPLSRGVLTERLAEVGRVGDDPDSVSAALAYLRRTGRAERTGLGQWVARVPPPA